MHRLIPLTIALRPAPRLAVPATVLAIALAAGMPARTEAATFYVDNQSAGCSNSGAGSEAQPYCTIAAAVAARGAAGNTILVKPGTYREQVTVPVSGAAGSPFVLRATGPGVVVDGADDLSGAGLWAQTGPAASYENHVLQAADAAWVAASVTWSPQQVFVNGVRLAPTTAAPSVMPINTFTWISGQGLYVNVGGGNPGLGQVLVGRRSYGFSMFAKSWVTIEGFEIARQESRGVYLQTGCSNVTVAGNRVRLTRSYGIQTVGGSAVTIQNNVVSDCGYHGIGLTAGSNGCTVRGNESLRNADPDIRRANGIYLHGSTGNTLSGNNLHDNQDSGMQFSGAANNNVAWNNLSWNNGDHGYDHLSASGTIHYNDIASGNYKDGFSIEGNAPYTQLYNCIGVNNGITTDEFNLWVNDSSSVGFVSNHNIFWNSTSQPPIKYIATKYSTLAGYQAASGQDANSRQADPRFVNGPGGDFRLLAGSPAIDAGTSNGAWWPASDMSGQGRLDDPATANTGAGPVLFGDIGAFEFVPTVADRAPVVVSPSLVKAAPGSTVNFTVTASDPDGHPIQSLTMVPVKMPANHGAVFTTNAAKTSGTFTWALGTFKGDFQVRFVATNALSGSATTNIKVKATGRNGAEEDGLVAGGPVLAFSNAFPNPSRSGVEFALDVPGETEVRWEVFDLQGRTVWSEARAVAAGRTQLRWDGRTATGDAAATGVYLVRAAVDGAVFQRRIVRF